MGILFILLSICLVIMAIVGISMSKHLTTTQEAVNGIIVFLNEAFGLENE